MASNDRPSASPDGLAVFLTFSMDGPDEQRTFLEAYRPVVEGFVRDRPAVRRTQDHLDER